MVALWDAFRKKIEAADRRFSNDYFYYFDFYNYLFIKLLPNGNSSLSLGLSQKKVTDCELIFEY